MKNMTKEEEEYYIPFLEEGLKDLEENETISLEDFIEELKRDIRRYEKYLKKNTTKVHLANWQKKTTKKFVKI